MSRSNVARKIGFLCQASVLILAAVVVAPGGAGASPGSSGAPPPDYVDYCGAQCHDILPGGQGGGVPTWRFLEHAATTLSTQMTNSDDQRNLYEKLPTGYQGLTDDKIGQFMNSASFGMPKGTVPKIVVPEARKDVTISRDDRGIPHIKGVTRDGTTYGAGYATAEDRLWVMDVLRNMARGSGAHFAGEDAKGLQEELWPDIVQTESELQEQVQRLAAGGDEGKQAVHDLESYVAGINGYIDEITKRHGPLDYGSKVPIEYKGTGNVPLNGTEGIRRFTITDVAALVTLMSSKFGSAGGDQVQAAVAKTAAQKRYGPELGGKVWDSLRAASDPETVETLRGEAKPPYGVRPENPRHEAMPDAGSVVKEPLYRGESPSANATSRPTEADQRTGSLKHGMSNALVVSGAHTKSGNPIAVFGPQAGYFAPQVFMLMEIQGPGLSARGVVFPGTGPYVEMGRGVDYSWSATSAHQSSVDSYAVELCNTDGSPASMKSNGYLFRGKCLPMEYLQSVDKLQVWRTKYGIVSHRATVDGVPVAYTRLRSSYRNELASSVAFMRFNTPEYLTGPEKFQEAASLIDYTFNWFYVDAKDTAFYNSGHQPIRSKDVDPDLPMWARPETEWRNWDPDTNSLKGVPSEDHPQSINQDYYVNWNNKTAEGQTYAGFGNSSVHRVDLLDSRVKQGIADGKKMDRAALTQVMAEAGITDLRGERVLPKLLDVLYSNQSNLDPAVTRAVNSLQDWLAQGAKRTTEPGQKTYLDKDAIKIMDAWWPLLVKAIFEPGMGKELYDEVGRNLTIDESPSSNGQHRGSAFEKGWWSYVDKDLRAVLGQKVDGPLPTTFCGTLEQCRNTLSKTLAEAVKKPSEEVYPADSNCVAGDSWCADSIQFKKMGAITVPGISWQNRPTYQQVVEFPTHR
ncbi:penicillin acylase family protein [Amycolatopsis azurea]|uniref:penicillin acylase family protein n=1 Tax=Amycolatopsis azurea TaxID=36819 RepID=UPI00381CA48B